MSSTPIFTVDQFSDDPEVWNVRDPSGKIVSQQDSKPDADGLAMVYESIYRSGYQSALTSERAKVERLREAASELVHVAELRGDCELPHPADDPKLWTVRMTTAWDDLRTALKETSP